MDPSEALNEGRDGERGAVMRGQYWRDAVTKKLRWKMKKDRSI